MDKDRFPAISERDVQQNIYAYGLRLEHGNASHNFKSPN